MINDISVLVIEDDKSIQNFIRITLKTKGYNSVFADDGLTGISCFYANNPDIILLDLGLPDIDGMEVLSQIRKESNIPVIVVSARGMEQEKVNALDEGADDYLTKPFHAGELLARIRVALRHKSGIVKQETAFELEGFNMDFEKRKLIVRGEEVHVTPIEYKMLKLLVLNAGKVLTHHFIQNEIWGYETNDDYQSIRVFMANIRRKIEEDSANPRFIITEVGVGYRFTEN
ncbi:MAG: DNA-binding response regulator [Lacrimispora sp.]|jgi:two-component system KDP operon response regulator KdpE|nr:DNA-binding response regulator [Lacrimispora sp.]